jgi:hypothetical protein
VLRTTIKVTVDARVSMIVAESVVKMHDQKPVNWDDNYDEVK